MKCSISKGDKKKKKDVAAQMAILEAELEARHEQELKALNEQDASKAVSWDDILLQYSLHYNTFDSILCCTFNAKLTSGTVTKSCEVLNPAVFLICIADCMLKKRKKHVCLTIIVLP